MSESTKWAEGLINRIKAAQDDHELQAVRQALEVVELRMEPVEAGVVRWWLNRRQRELDKLQLAGIAAGERITLELTAGSGEG